jgi:hypothetical protein
MMKIQSGPATSVLAVANDGIAHARPVGLYLSANSRAISAQLLQAATREGALGMIVAIDGVAFAMPAMTPEHYSYVPQAMRGIPVALVVNPEQAAFLGSVQSAAAQAGTLRRIFLSQGDAMGWLKEQTRALAANRLWWSQRRSASP